jgi:diguanylate cyclase (GGDEF)-like protein
MLRFLVEGAIVSDNRKLEGYEEETDDRTAIVSLKDLKAPRKQAKDRHLLVRVRGAELGRVTLLSPERVRVGRSQDSELWLSDDGVSRRHATLVREGAHYIVEDEGSANGTFVGGVKVTRHELRDGDVIQFGPTAVFRYTLSDESQETLLRQLYDASVTDALTGAHNREHFDTQLRAELSYARRHNTDVSLVIFDADHFKKVNDTYGHDVGDIVIKGFADVLKRVKRDTDAVGRFGGEEFVIVCEETDEGGAQLLAERIRTELEAVKFHSELGTLQVTCSVGVAPFPNSGQTWEQLFKATDEALYASKRGGRNRVTVWTPRLSGAAA